ncbi:MAG: hypothetical protein MHMPM18_004994 [Marteilia pararefringens]
MDNDWDYLNDLNAKLPIVVFAPQIIILMLLALTIGFKNGEIQIMVPLVLAVSMLFCAGCIRISSLFMERQRQQLINSREEHSKFKRCRKRYIALWSFLLFLSLTQFVTLCLASSSRFKTEIRLIIALIAIVSFVAFLLIAICLYKVWEINGDNVLKRKSEVFGITDQNDATRSSI